MKRVELVAKIAEELNVSKKLAGEFVEKFEEIVLDEVLNKGEDIKLKIGKFRLVERKAREGVNPQNPSEKIKIPASKSVGFRAGKVAKQ